MFPPPYSGKPWSGTGKTAPDKNAKDIDSLNRYAMDRWEVLTEKNTLHSGFSILQIVLGFGSKVFLLDLFFSEMCALSLFIINQEITKKNIK